MNSRYRSRRVAGYARLWTLAMLLCAGASASTRLAQAQDSNQGPSDPAKQTASPGDSSMAAVPNRPTFSTTAEAVQKGVFEIEFGLEAADGHQDLNGLFKFGLLEISNYALAIIRFCATPVLWASAIQVPA
jgi:hypothetical protein